MPFYNQTNITTTPAIVVPNNANRTNLILNASATFYIGSDANVTPVTGLMVPANTNITLTGVGDIWACVATGTATMSYFDQDN